MNGSAYEYEGYVESINIKGVGPNSHQFLFSLLSRKGDKHWSFLLDPLTEPSRYNAMASLLTMAFGANQVVKVNTNPGVGGPLFVGDIEVFREPR